MKQDTIIWIGLTIIFLLGIALAGSLHTQASVHRSAESCARSAGWISDEDCRAMCSGRAE